MKQGKIEIRHNFAGETGYVILKAYKTSNLSVSIPGMTDVYSAPHSETTYLKTELDPVMYVVKAFRSSDGTSEDQEINSLACDASIAAVHLLETYYYIVGRGQSESDDDGIIWADPEEGDNQIVDKRLDGKNFTVEERATGKLLPQTEMGGEWEALTDGGFKFVDTEKQFWEGGVYAVTVQYRSNIVISDELGVSGIKIITEDTDFISEDYGKTIFANGANVSVVKYTIPLFNSIPDGELKFSNNLTGQRYLVIQFAFGNSVSLQGVLRNRICLSQGDTMTIIKIGNSAYITDDPKSYSCLGGHEYTYQPTPSQHALDGSEHELSDFPKVEDFINSLPSGSVVSFTTWNTSQNVPVDNTLTTTRTVYPNKGFWAVNGSGRFKFPDSRKLSVKGFLSGDADRLNDNVGGFQVGRSARHSHEFDDFYYPASAGTLSGAANKATLPPSPYNQDIGSRMTDNNGRVSLVYRHPSAVVGSTTDMGGSVDNIGLIAVINI